MCHVNVWLFFFTFHRFVRCEKNTAWLRNMVSQTSHVDGIVPKGPYLSCLRMADRALLAGYPQCEACCGWHSGRSMISVPHSRLYNGSTDEVKLCGIRYQNGLYLGNMLSFMIFSNFCLWYLTLDHVMIWPNCTAVVGKHVSTDVSNEWITISYCLLCT